ncbi:hypothetical protein ACVWW7_001710 [Bradyrhizobium sp. LM6.9]
MSRVCKPSSTASPRLQMDDGGALLGHVRMIERRIPRARHRLRMMSPAAEHVGRGHDDKRLAARANEPRVEIGQQRGFAAPSLRHLAPIGKALRLDAAHALYRAKVILDRRDEQQPRSTALHVGDESAKCLARRGELRELRRRDEGGLARQHAEALLQPLPVRLPQIFALRISAAGGLLDRAEPAIGMGRHPGIHDPSRATAIIRQRRPLSARSSQRDPFGHGVDGQFLGLVDDLVLDRIDGDDLADRLAGMLDPEGRKCAGGKYFERLAVEQDAAGILRLFVEIVAERFQPALQLGPRIGRAHLQREARPRPARRQRQPFHDGFRGGHQEDRLLGLGEAPQHRAAPARDLAGRLEAVEGQRVQARKHQHFDQRIERVDHAAQPLRPALVVAEEHEAVAAGFFPLLEQMQRQHTERR